MTTSATTAVPPGGTAPDHHLVPPLPRVRARVAALRTGGAR
jgi:hypothetical protein